MNRRAVDHDIRQVEGEGLFPTARDFHNGVFKAQVAPQSDAIAFADDGSNYGDGCQARMQRIVPWLLVVDNAGCGGRGRASPGSFAVSTLQPILLSVPLMLVNISPISFRIESSFWKCSKT
jgi:hypothetical protein